MTNNLHFPSWDENTLAEEKNKKTNKRAPKAVQADCRRIQLWSSAADECVCQRGPFFRSSLVLHFSVLIMDNWGTNGLMSSGSFQEWKWAKYWVNQWPNSTQDHANEPYSVRHSSSSMSNDHSRPKEHDVTSPSCITPGNLLKCK